MKENSEIIRKVNAELSSRRQAAALLRDRRIEEVNAAIPEYAELSDNIKRMGVRLGRLAISGKKSSEEYYALEKEIKEQSSRMADMLAENGYPREYLNDVYSCAACRDKGEIYEEGAARYCGCFMNAYTKQLMRESNLTQNQGFEAFDLSFYAETPAPGGVSPRERAAEALEIARAFVEGFDSGNVKDLLFLGGTGVGKTFISGCIACELIKKGVPVLYISAAELLSELTYFGQDDERSERRELLEKIIYTIELLIIDDLGAERQTEARYGILMDLLNRRTADGRGRRKTIISSNLSLKELLKLYDERVFSRIAAFGICELLGDDIRIIKKRRN